MLNYGPQNAWNQQLQSLVNQANALQNMQQVAPQPVQQSIQIPTVHGLDAVHFMKGWEEARGCKLEHQTAEAYGIDII